MVVPPSLVLILLGDAMLSAHTFAINATGRTDRVINTQDVLRAAIVPAALYLLLSLIAGWYSARRDCAAEPSMEDHTPPTTSPEQVSARSASALRELHERAQAALAASRDQALHLEAEITRQFDEISTALHEQSTTGADDAAEIERARAEIARRRRDRAWRAGLRGRLWRLPRDAARSRRRRGCQRAHAKKVSPFHVASTFGVNASRCGRLVRTRMPEQSAAAASSRKPIRKSPEMSWSHPMR